MYNSLFSEQNDVEDDDEYVEDPYNDSLSAVIAESAALAERERCMKQGESLSRDTKQRKIIRKDTYFSDEEDCD